MTDPTQSPMTLLTLHAAARCLALFDRTEIAAQPNGGLTRAGWRLLHNHAALDQPPHAPRGEPDVPVLSWLYRSLGAGGLIGVVSSRIRISRTAHDWLALSAQAQLIALRQIWFRLPEVAWAWLPPSSGLQTRAHVWHEATQQLAATVAALPVDTYVLVSDVVVDLAAQSETLAFGVARNLPSVRQAVARQIESLACCQLTELLPRLGVLSLAGEGAETSMAVLPEGATWLRDALKQDPAALSKTPAAAQQPEAEARPCWRVTADLRLIIPPEAPAAATFEALQFADLLTPDPPAAYRITRASLEGALARGYDLADLLFTLTDGAHAALPGPAFAQLAQWGEAAAVIRCEPGYRLRPSGPVQLAALRAREPFRAATEPAASGAWAFVEQPKSAALFRYLRRAGYLVQVARPDHPDADAVPPLPALQRRCLPLLQLAALAGVYARLQVRVPGLADLGVAALEQRLLATLPAEARAAVARLVTSDDALLTARLGQTTDAEDDSTPAQIGNGLQDPPEPPAGPATLSGLMDALSAAIAADVQLELLYADTGGTVTQRRVWPLRLEERWGRRYLVAHCELRGDERSFRLDRIVEITPAITRS